MVSCHNRFYLLNAMMYTHIVLMICYIEFYAVIFDVGHTLAEVFILREGRFKRIPDLVVWPGK